MKYSTSRHRPAAKILGIVIAASLLPALLPGRASSSENGAPAATQPAPAPPANPKAWRALMRKVPLPKKGCFRATFPNTAWHEVPCRTAPLIPYPPASEAASDTVGNGLDFSAKVSNLISEAVGSFDSVTGVTSESDRKEGGRDAFSLQLNSSFFNSPACAGAASPKCRGWQQFVYSNFQSRMVYMQYWLINYDARCPPSWHKSGHDCFANSAAADVPPQPIAQLGVMSVKGEASEGGMDTVILGVGTELYSASGEDSVLNLAQSWKVAEFNVFGDCCATEAMFNKGSTIVVRTSVDDGVATAPSCLNKGFTGETNNLTLVKTSAVPPEGTSPEIVFTESNTGGAGQGELCHPTAEE